MGRHPSQAEGIAIPYGIYDVTHNTGFVVVGTSHQTPEFAASAIRRWWRQVGQAIYKEKKHILVEADCGGGNGSRCWLWKWGCNSWPMISA